MGDLYGRFVWEIYMSDLTHCSPNDSMDIMMG